jgi:hypothetical protein
LLDGLSQNDFAFPVRVAVGSVEKVDPALVYFPNDFDGFLFLYQPIEPFGITKAHTAKAKAGDLIKKRREVVAK